MPDITGRHDLSLVQRLTMQIEDANGCWQWRGATTANLNSYGRIRVNGRKELAHRASFQVFIRSIPEGLTLDHLCRNRLCINPFHLVPRTQHENVLVGKSKMATLAVTERCGRGHEFNFEFYNLKGKRSIRRFCRTCRTLYRKAYNARIL